MTAFVVAGIAACTGQPASTPVTTHSPAPPTTSAPATLTANLCDLLGWPDFGYPGIAPDAQSPTKSGDQPGWSQSCEWSSYQADAGYTEPTEDPACVGQVDSHNVGHCLDADAQRLASITANSKPVNVAIGWRPGDLLLHMTSKYTQAGKTVYLDDESASWTCLGGVWWANGSLQVEVQDATKAFGTPCDQTKKIIGLLIQREPNTGSRAEYCARQAGQRWPVIKEIVCGF
jgi:hypothetical protein